MKISIITVCFNSAVTIADTLRSVREQRYPDIEHIVIDGGSTDCTAEIVSAEGAHVAKFISEPDRGIYDAMNKGIGLASGDVIGFLNSDDFFSDPDVIGRIANQFSGTAIDACYGDLVYVDSDELSKVVRYWKSREFKPGLCTHGWMPAHPTFYAKIDVYRRFGGFDLDFKLQSDFEMALRLLEVKKISTAYIPEILVRMRIGGASNSSLKNIFRGNIEAAQACRKHGYSGGLVFVIRKIFSRFPQFIFRPTVDV